MTQPTIAELRAMAERERTQAMFDGHAATVMIIDAFLRYTDDRPLTAGDCRLAGMIPMDGTSNDLECDAAIWCECGEPCVELLHPTVGQLNLALDLERERAK